MKKQIPWKRFFAGVVIAAVCCMLLAEFGAVFLFIAGIFGLSALWVFGRAWWDARRNRRNQEISETIQAEARQKEIGLRQEACRRARYCREERELIEAHFQRTLGPVEAWDFEKNEDILCLNAALISPTEDMPYWKAATVGAGAYTMAGGYAINSFRAELVMALPPDWDMADRWPVQVLRDAVRRFLVVEGFVGYNSVYRGFSILSAGFAGAVVTDDIPGLPEIGFAAMPEGLPVYFFWLVPLLKPELDYFRERGLHGLERRFQDNSPWADPGRKPCADPLTWFHEDIAPFTWSEDEGRFCLGLDTAGFHQELFRRAGITGTGWDWERLVRAYLRRYQPNDGPFVEYACEERVFFAASEDQEIMRRLALGLSDLLRDSPEQAGRLLSPDSARSW